MTRIRSAPAGQRRLLADLDNILTPRPRPHLPVVIWRWRYELALLAAVAGTAAALVRVLGTEWGIVAASALAGVFAPPWPEPLAGWAWCVITPHRLRAGFSEARLRTTRGKLPAIMRVARAPFGERVLVWCPAGISAEDLRSAGAVLRAACWAADVRITRDERRAQLVTIDVIRRATGDEAQPPGTFPEAA